MVQYIMVEERLSHPNLGEYLSFGIAALKNGEQIILVSDISTNKNDVLKLAERCSKEKLSPVHLYDVVEDYLN